MSVDNKPGLCESDEYKDARGQWCVAQALQQQGNTNVWLDMAGVGFFRVLQPC